MLDNGNRKCPFGDEIVAYMYDEIDGAEAGVFESHLADCTTCTDEFAAISNARFSVYEWQKEEFAHLPTPAFSIPYDVKPVTGSTGILAGVRELFAFNNWPVTVAAALTVVIGVGFFAMKYTGSGDQPTVANKIDVPIEKPSTPSSDVAVRTPREEPEAVASPQAVKVVEKRTPNTRRSPAPKQGYASKKAPVLNDFDDDADTTLRLTDLFDGIGG